MALAVLGYGHSAGWRLGFTNPAPIVKDNTKKLILDVAFSVARGV
ncbi:hypothetical protein ACFQDE_00355 [Deinococcus caeni]